jgi:hypothetical protein
MAALLGISLKAPAGCAEQLGRHRQVVLGADQVFVAQIRRETRQQGLQIRTGAIPTKDPMDGTCMAQVMQARLITCTTITEDAGRCAKSPEGSLDDRLVHASAIA